MSEGSRAQAGFPIRRNGRAPSSHYYCGPWTAGHGDPEQATHLADDQERAVNGGRQSVKWFDSRL